MSGFNFGSIKGILSTITEAIDEHFEGYRLDSYSNPKNYAEIMTENGWEFGKVGDTYTWYKPTTTMSEVATTIELATRGSATELIAESGGITTELASSVSSEPVNAVMSSMEEGATVGRGVPIVELVGEVGVGTALASSLAYAAIGSIAAYFGYKLGESAYESNPEFWDNVINRLFGESSYVLIDKDGHLCVPWETYETAYEIFSEYSGDDATRWENLNGESPTCTITDSVYTKIEYPNFTKEHSFVGMNGTKFLVHKEYETVPEMYNRCIYVCTEDTDTSKGRYIETITTTNKVTGVSTTQSYERRGATYSQDRVITLNGNAYYHYSYIGDFGVEGPGYNVGTGYESVTIIPSLTGSITGTLNFSWNEVGDLPTGLVPVEGVVHPDRTITPQQRYPLLFNRRTKRNAISKIPYDEIEEDIPDTFYVPIMPLSESTKNDLTPSIINVLHAGTYTPSQISNWVTTSPNVYPNIGDQTQEQAKQKTDTSGGNPTTPTPGDGGETDKPSSFVPVPSGVDTGLVVVYNPSRNDVVSFSQWLWSSGFNLDTFKKLFQDPMSAIISLHAVYCTPVEAGVTSIVVGYIDSGVDSPYVTETTVTLNCGSIYIPEYYKNVLDYDPYTEFDIYLPFIGFRKLSANDVVNSTVNVTYHIDLITGTCVAFVSVSKRGYSAILYTFEGNCAVQIPLTSANFSSIISGVMGTALAIGTAVASGGATLPLAVGMAGNAVLNSRINIERGGSLQGNGGAISPKKPYIVCRRPISETAFEYNEFIGYPSNATIILGNCKGFTRVKECHLDKFDATETEKSELYNVLKSGVII